MLQPFVLRECLAQLCPQWAWSEIHNITFLSGGYSNHNYRLRYRDTDFVLRVPGVRQPFVDRVHEARWYERLPVGLSARLVALDQASGAMLTEWIDGQLLADLPSVEDQALLEFLERLHTALPHTSREYRVEDIFPLQPTAGADMPAELPSQLNLNNLTTCHNDLNPWNVMIDKHDNWVTLDWEFVGRNDPLFDLICLHQGLARSDLSLLPLCATYLKAPEDDLDLRVQMSLQTFWMRELGWAQYQISHGNERREVVDQVHQASRELQRLAANTG